MSKLMKSLAIVALLAGAMAMAPRPAQAHWHGGWHGGWHGWHGGWRGGWHGWRGGWGWGGFGWGYPGYYYAPYYYARPEECGWVRIRYWRYGRWHWRRVWRCW